MPIVTLTEAKTLLQISGSIYDSLITMIIPIVEEKIIDHCNNHFIDEYNSHLGILPSVYTYGNTFEFINSDNSINNADKDFTTMNFKVGDNIRVYNSIHNDRTFTISSIAANKIVVDSINTVNDEDLDNTIVIAKVTFPASLKITASQMINWNLKKHGVYFKSEKFDDYLYTRDDELVGGYPSAIMDGLTDYCSAYLKQIPFNLLYIRQD
jgi:hypothetical protein